MRALGHRRAVGHDAAQGRRLRRGRPRRPRGRGAGVGQHGRRRRRGSARRPQHRRAAGSSTRCGPTPASIRPGRRIAVLGAGGAARSVIDALGRAGAAEVVVVNRTLGRRRARGALGRGGRPGRHARRRARRRLVVNATSVGMGSDVLALDPALLRHGALVADLVYHPLDTALLQAARATRLPHARRARHAVHQAAPPAGAVDRPRPRCGRHAGRRRGRARRRLSEAKPASER